MGKIITYGSSFNSVPIDYSAIFGANYIDDFDFNSLANITTTGSLIDLVTTKGSTGRSLFSNGVRRPTQTLDATLGKYVGEFDGVSEYMEILTSESYYNFLHDGSGGCVITVYSQSSNSAFVVGNSDFLGDVGFWQQTTNSIGRVKATIGNGSSYAAENQNDGETVPLNAYNSFVNVMDADNATLADRSEITFNGGGVLKANTSSGIKSTANSSRTFTVGVLADKVSGFSAVNVARIIILDTIPTPTQLAQVQARLEFDYGTFPI